MIRFEVIYLEKFTKTIKSPEHIADWRACWGSALAGIDLMKIKSALEQCAEKHIWPPSTAEFLALCNPPAPKLNYEGLFIDAANGRLTDKITYWAAQSFGLFELRRWSYPACKDRWIAIVDQMVANTELPNIPAPQEALPAPGQTISREAAHRGIEDVKTVANGYDDFREWAKNPKSQAAVDLMFSHPPMYNEIEIAKQAGAIIGRKWIEPHKRVSLADRCAAGRKILIEEK
jgi:hypothetical protein